MIGSLRICCAMSDCSRESARKVRLRLALTLKELGLNLMNQYCAAPAVLNGGVSVAVAFHIMWCDSGLIIWRTGCKSEGICSGRSLPARIFPLQTLPASGGEHSIMKMCQINRTTMCQIISKTTSGHACPRPHGAERLQTAYRACQVPDLCGCRAAAPCYERAGASRNLRIHF
jgi:hypothetical protein